MGKKTSGDDPPDKTKLFSDSELPEQRKPPPPGKTTWICRPFITLRNGRKLFAWEVGKKAFCFYI